ncbi:MAP kinase-activated protein kinase 2 (Fragment) [Seminavis robusta]|uniref:MAP kinase-activated protein kinase 2 n=1 Tax=Seminavis robusta TaxID=568900 RepID=A0A9N8HN53_9STRA
MGNCQTTKAVDHEASGGAVAKPKVQGGSSSPDTQSTGSQKDHGTATPTTTPTNEHHPHHATAEPTETVTTTADDSSLAAPPSPPGWAANRGYSSGASSSPLSSSCHGEEEDQEDQTSSSRPAMDPLHLISMRNLMHSNGGLTQTVVRLETPFGQPIESIYEGVHDGPYLGDGVAGVVRLVTHRATRVQYACKILDIGLVQTDAVLRQLRDEISIMCQLDHPNIVRIEEVYESPNTIYLVQEVCLGGDLFDRLEDQPDVHYTEAQCAKLIKQMVSAVRYLHSKGVIHRDLKLENFLFSSSEPDSELKMIDFGLSKHFDLDENQERRPLTESVGTPYTCAPEVIKGSYDEKADIWSVGVITYLLLSGETPFGGCYENECLAAVRQSILSGSFSFEPADIWCHVSPIAKAFVSRLLNVDPELRPTAKEVQRDEWLQIYGKKGSCEGNKLSPGIVDALVSFKEYSEMRRLLHEVLSFTLLPAQIVELREEFEKIDKDGDGEITLGAMKQVLTNSAGAGALGGLTEAEVEDIFDALRVNKNDSTIRWHEFIAAGLSQCKYDDRNLQLAFDRLDTDRKGYICFNDLTDLLGHAPETLENLKCMWAESMEQCSCEQGRISYDDFLILMKGQTRRKEQRRPSRVWSPVASSLVMDFKGLDDSDKADLQLPTMNQRPSGGHHRIPSTILEEEAPSPKKRQSAYNRKRSKSFDELSLDSEQRRRVSFPPRVRPSLSAEGDLIELIAADSKAPLLATREEYKRHRDFRLAVCQATKEFDIKSQARHAEIEAEKNQESTNSSMMLQGAGLIMKRGSLPPPELESEHQRMLFDAAVRRGGRKPHTRKPGHRRKRTQSDVTGMLL